MAGQRWQSCLLVLTMAATGAVAEAQKTVSEPGKKVPVAYDVDVVVCGGGIAGTMAALAAGRHGARTLVIDRFGRLGGNMGPGYFAGGSVHYALEDKDALVNRVGLGGIPAEFLRRIIQARPNADQMTPEDRAELERLHLNHKELRVGTGGRLAKYATDSLATSHVAFQMVKEAGVEMLLSAYVADPIMEGNRVRGVFVETKSGRLAVKAKVVIDATGEADVAVRAGAPFVADHRFPNCGVTFAMMGVDYDLYRKKVPNPKEPGGFRFKMIHPKEADGFRFKRPIPGYPEAGVTVMLKQPYSGICFGRTGGGAKGINFADAKQVTIIEREHRIHVYEYAAFMRKHSPAFKNAYLLFVAPYLGARGGRYLDSVYRISGYDMLAERKFNDVIYRYYDSKKRKSCEMPYRMLVPKKIDGLLAAGRSSHSYGPNFRVRYCTLQNGQAAGIAAALCVKDGVEPRDLDVRKLQRALLKLRAPFADDQRLKELGLK